MWIRYVLVGIIALLVGMVIGGRFFPAGPAAKAAQPVIASLEPIPEGIQSWRFVIANPDTGRVTVFEASDRLEVVGFAEY